MALYFLFMITFVSYSANYLVYAGTFWHISDLHVDQNYSRSGNDHNLCHSSNKQYPDNGKYGNFLCDSPQVLIDVTIETMKLIYPKPDFIIWTGDNLPHNDKVSADWSLVFEAIKNTTDIFISNFGSTHIIPCIGNHDTFPPNLLLPGGSVYKDYLEKGGWDKLLPKDTWNTFLKGGYFSYSLFPDMRIISLNTILWYIPNTYTKEMDDPGDQLKWLENCLKNCFKNSQKVYIIGHVPPGFYNRVPMNSSDVITYHPQHLKAYSEILSKYDSVILAQMYGHIHLDYFQVFQYGSGTFRGSSLIASSITPWHSEHQGNYSLPVNPSVRLMHYSKGDFVLQDYDQYYANLTALNNNGPEKNGNAYKLLYTFRKTYHVPDLSTESLVEVYEKLKSDSQVYDTFFSLMTAGKRTVDCDHYCQVTQLCAMTSITDEEYHMCRKNIPDNHPLLVKVPEGVSSVLIYGLVILFLVVIALGVFVRFKWYKHRNGREEYRPFTTF